MGIGDLVSQSLGDSSSFNWPWFVVLCVSGILVLFFLFYFNRLFATLVSYGIRAYVWHALRVWIDIQAIQISLLGGRVFFKGIRYHGENETILIHSGYITWRYWLKLIRQVDLTRYEGTHEQIGQEKTVQGALGRDSDVSDTKDEELGPVKKADTSDARISVSVNGVEWFIYNRTPMYDAIIHDVRKKKEEGSTSDSYSDSHTADGRTESYSDKSGLRKRPVSDDTFSSDHGLPPKQDAEKSTTDQRQGSHATGNTSVKKEVFSSEGTEVSLAQSILIRSLPIYIECGRAAISIGNEYTKAILVTTVEKAKGHIDASGCGPNDLFRQVFNFEIEHPVVQMRPNPDFRATQLIAAERIIVNTPSKSRKTRWWQVQLDLRRRKRDAIYSIRNLMPWLRSSVESLHYSQAHGHTRFTYSPFDEADPDSNPWHGLDRYLDETDGDDHYAWNNVDYARFSTILDCPAVHLTFYWDVPGRVTQEHVEPSRTTANGDINGVQAPKYGLDLTVKGGQVNYGPWADRLRAELQAMFLPASYSTPTVASQLAVGAWRQSTVMTIRIDIEAEVTLRVPTKENSKDWRWRGRATAVRDAAALRNQRERRHFRFRRGQKGVPGPDIRPFGWITIAVAADSSVRYEMDMVPAKSGYRNKLHLDLRDTKATSSVNHAVLWQCRSQQLQCDLSNPLKWNDYHCWHFNVQNESMDIYLLRDHMFLLTDLISDFTAGQKAEYMTFVPFRYNIGLRFDNLKLYLNANDYNIIDNPSELDNNTFLVLGVGELASQIEIPMQHFSSAENSVMFKARGSDLYLDLKTPIWSTLNAFSKDEMAGTLKRLELDGSYNYFAETSPQLTDSLIMNIVGKSAKFCLQGFLIRYFMNVKENYFGEDLHFRTFEEYQAVLTPDNRIDAEDSRPQNKKENDLDVILSVRAEECYGLMPGNIYNRYENIRIDVMNIDADMRFTNYYMDLQVESSPVEVSLETSQVNEVNNFTTSNCQLYIDSVSVFGHRLFGAPPTEPTYLCNWDFDIGSISGECSADFVRILIGAVQSFVFTLDDDENALPLARVDVIHDVIFLRARAATFRVWIVVGDAAFLIEIGAFDLMFNDWAKGNFSANLRAVVPDIMLAAVDLSSTRHQIAQTSSTLACLQTSVKLALIDKKADSRQDQELQQRHVRFHDLRTHRTDWLLKKQPAMKLTSNDTAWSREAAAMPVPDMPNPISDKSSYRDRSILEGNSSRQVLHPMSSFVRPSSRSSTGGSEHSQMSREGSQQNRRRKVQNIQHDSTFATRHDQVPSAERAGKSGSDQIFSAVGFSSPWIPPYFSLQKLSPDTSNLPNIFHDFDTATTTEVNEYESDEEFEGTDEHIAHASVFCKLPNGVSAFCLPSFSSAMLHLLRGVASPEPMGILDAMQQSTISSIKNLTLQRKLQIDDLAVYIPNAAIRLISPAEQLRPQNPSSDQFDLLVNNARLMLRTSPNVTTHGDGRMNDLLVHTYFQKISLSIVENFQSQFHGAAGLYTSMTEGRIWLSMQDRLRSNIQVNALEVSSRGPTVDRLSALLTRSRNMVEAVSSEIEDVQQSPTQHLIHHLVSQDFKTADPVFLSRPSYVLRSAGVHVRSSDSWKVMAVLRQRLAALPRREQVALLTKHNCEFEALGEDEKRRALASLSDAKGAESDDLSLRPIMKAVFGTAGAEESQNATSNDINVAILLGQASFVLNPGPQQSQVSLYGMDSHYLQKPLSTDGAKISSGDTDQRISRSVHGWFAETQVNLHWELVELIRSLVANDSKSEGDLKPTQSTQSPPAESSKEADDLTILIGTDEAALSLTGINFSVDARAWDLKTSLIQQQVSTVSTTSLILVSQSTETRIMSGTKTLLRWQLHLPNVYASHQRDLGPYPSPDTVRIAANCETLRFGMEQDLVSLLKIASAILKDEVQAIMHIAASIEQNTVPTEPQMPSGAAKQLDLHAALFLDNYKLKIALLPTLQYVISGRVGRTSIVPHEKSQFAIHLDAGRSHHMLLKPGSNTRNAICVLEIPPINGKLSLKISEQNLRIKAQTTVERVVVEASMVQACFDAIYRPENTQFVEAAKSAIEEIKIVTEKTLANDLEKTQPLPQAQSVQRTVHYSAHASFEGLLLQCDTPLREEQDHARLQLNFQHTIFRVHNVQKNNDQPFEQPQFEINMPGIVFGIYRHTKIQSHNVGQCCIGVKVTGAAELDKTGIQTQNYRVFSNGVQLDLSTAAVPVIFDSVTYLQDRIKSLTSAEERKNLRPLRRLTIALNDGMVQPGNLSIKDDSDAPPSLLNSTFSLDLNNIQARWILDAEAPVSPGRRVENMVFSIRRIDLQTQREGSAHLTILDLQLQLVPKDQKNQVERTPNSALLPEMAFKAAHLSSKHDRRFAFQAAGKALDLRLAADGIVPLSMVQKSLAKATAELRGIYVNMEPSSEASLTPTRSLLGNKRLASLLVDADFAGAIFTLTPRIEEQQSTAFGMLKGVTRSRAGRYGQAVHSGSAVEAILRAPGIALKVEYRDSGTMDPTLSSEIKVAASTNTLAPSVVPLILEIYSSIKEIIGESDATDEKIDGRAPAQKYLADAANPETDPTAILGRVKLNAGLWVQRQEFSLTCQPIARVQATTKFDDIFITMNTVQEEQNRFFSIIVKFNNLEASVQHVYSRESTASFDVESIVMSLMNSKHVNSKNGISAILNVSPMRTNINAKQLQDFLLFREIWYPEEVRHITKTTTPETTPADSQVFTMQKYQELTTTAALPWHAVVSVKELRVQVDFGQGLGKSSFAITELWASSKKSSDWEQNLCVGFRQVGIDSSGRMSGFVELQNFHARTLIKWPAASRTEHRAPLVQASLGFDHLRLKAAFDYQPFAVADVSSFDFLMYNVRPDKANESDRLVGILDGGKIQAFCTSAAAGQVLAIIQAFERLIQERRDAYQDSLHELERLLRRKSIMPSSTYTSNSIELDAKSPPTRRTSHLLHTDVVVTLKAVDIGVFPNTFFDNQILKVEAADAQARFAVASVDGKIRSGLGMSLGQVRVALSAVGRSNTKALGEVEISEVIERATASRGGTIMKVPRLVASMQTWQQEQSNVIEYIFRSTFQGKVDVGWNYSRISFIRSMWETHSKALAHRLGKPLPPAAVKITTGPQGADGDGQEKITAVVNMPHSNKFEYVALEPAVIDTPQLRDMGEATPPLEWIGLHRDKLPNVTHSIIIVTLLEVAKEVEEAYTRILGTGQPVESV